MAHFILFLRGVNQNLKDYSPEELQKLFEQYEQWVEQLKTHYQLQSLQKLKDEVMIVTDSENDTAKNEGRLEETEKTIGGFFVLEAEDQSEVVTIAEKCPVLTHGGSVEVRELVTNDL